MNSRQLFAQNTFYFLNCAGKPSLHAAAEHLSVSVPTLSIALSQLESQIGFKLFDRGRSGIRLTPKGAILREELVATIGALDAHIETLRSGEAPLRVGVGGPLCARSVLPALTSNLVNNQAKLPPIDYVVDRSRDLTNRVIAGKLDCAFIVATSKPRGVKSTYLWQDPMGIVGLKSHYPQLANAKSIADIKDLPWVVGEKEGSLPGVGNGIVNEAVRFADSTLGVKDLVLAGVCIAELHLGFFSADELRRLAVAPFRYFSPKMDAYFIQCSGSNTRKQDLETILRQVRQWAGAQRL